MRKRISIPRKTVQGKREKSGFFCWHLHHKGKLMEYCYDFERRVKFIKEDKPAHEVPYRLKWMKRVEGELPEEVKRAGQEYARALREHDRAGQEYDRALDLHKEEIEALHKKECPDCTWNGKELVFEKNGKNEG